MITLINVNFMLISENYHSYLFFASLLMVYLFIDLQMITLFIKTTIIALGQLNKLSIYLLNDGPPMYY